MIIKHIVQNDTETLKNLLLVNKLTHKFIAKNILSDNDVIKNIKLIKYDESVFFIKLVNYLVNEHYNLHMEYFNKNSTQQQNLQDIMTLTIHDKIIKIIFRCYQINNVVTHECIITFSAINPDTGIQTGDHFTIMYNVIGNILHINLDILNMTRINITDIIDLTAGFTADFKQQQAVTICTLTDVLLYIQSNFFNESFHEPFIDDVAFSAFIAENYTYTFKRKESNLVDRRISRLKTIETGDIKNRIKSFSEFLLEDELITVFGKELKKKKNQSIRLLQPLQPPLQPPLQLHQITPTVFGNVTPIPLLGYDNINLIWQYSLITKKSSIYLMQFYNFYLEQKDENKPSAVKQKEINRALISWKERDFSQPKFTEKIINKLKKIEKATTDVVKSYHHYGIHYKDKDIDTYTEDFFQTLEQNVNDWLISLNSMSPRPPVEAPTSAHFRKRHRVATTSLQELQGFEFYPLLIPTIGGKATNKNMCKFKRTNDRTLYNNKKYVINTGKRGGKYILLNNKYVLISKLNIKSVGMKSHKI